MPLGILDFAPMLQIAGEVVIATRHHGGNYGMDGDSVKTTLFNQVVQSRLSKIQHRRIPSRLAHASVMDIETVSKTDILMFNDVADLIFQIR